MGEGWIHFAVMALGVLLLEDKWRRHIREIEAIDALRSITGRPKGWITRRRATLLAAGAAILIPSITWGIGASFIRHSPWWAVLGFLSHALYMGILLATVLWLYPASQLLIRRDTT